MSYDLLYHGGFQTLSKQTQLHTGIGIIEKHYLFHMVKYHEFLPGFYDIRPIYYMHILFE